MNTEKIKNLYLKYISFIQTQLKEKGLIIRIKEFLILLWINFIVTLKNILELFKVIVLYWSNFSFFKADLSLQLMYLFHNPFKISKHFLQKQGAKEIYAYGETPLTSMAIIAKTCGIGPKDLVFELGAGRGRTAFWLNSFKHCSVVGIEFVEDFVERAQLITKRLDIKNVDFRLADMLTTDYTGATVCYLYGTCLDELTISHLAEKFSKLPQGTKIITVSYPLSDYTDLTCFEVMKRFTVPYPWGMGDVYLQIVKNCYIIT